MSDAPPPEANAGEPESFVIRLETGDRIHYLDWGVAADRPGAPPLPPLVLLHGITQTARIWAPVARRLQDVTDVIAVDLRGHGLSDPARSGYDLSSLAMDVLTVMTGHGWGDAMDGPPAVVAGHGFGAMIAATMAALRPASVAAIALVDGGWEDIAEATRASQSEFLAGLADPPEVMSSMDAFLADREAFDPATWDADQEAAARAQVDQKHAGHVGLVSRSAAVRGSVEAMYSYRPLEALTRAAVPMLVLVAEAATADDEDARERDLALDDVVRARASVGLVAPRVVRYPGSGHNLMRYRPAEVASELRALLESVATSARMPDGPA